MRTFDTGTFASGTFNGDSNEYSAFIDNRRDQGRYRPYDFNVGKRPPRGLAGPVRPSRTA